MNRLERKIRSTVQHYNEKRYWCYRNIIINPLNRIPRFIKIILLFYIKRSDAFNNTSLGTQLNCGALFESTPIFHTVYMVLLFRKMQKSARTVLYSIKSL